MNAKELEKLTLCRSCFFKPQCAVWKVMINSEVRAQIEKDGWQMAIVITQCPTLEGSAKKLIKPS